MISVGFLEYIVIYLMIPTCMSWRTEYNVNEVKVYKYMVIRMSLYFYPWCTLVVSLQIARASCLLIIGKDIGNINIIVALVTAIAVTLLATWVWLASRYRVVVDDKKNATPPVQLTNPNAIADSKSIVVNKSDTKSLANEVESESLEANQDSIPTSRTDLLNNRMWIKLVEDCVELFDEIDRIRPSLDNILQDFADHISCRIVNILERNSVDIIRGTGIYDRNRHQFVKPHSTEKPDGELVVEIISPGFSVDRRVLRRAQVKMIEEPSK